MKTIRLNLDKSKKYIVACSYGPDSMALLDAAIKENLSLAVAHVNYRKRDVSVFEQESLTKYCESKNIKIHVLDLLDVKSTGNFQEWAREKRYEFFKEVLIKENADAVLVAHQQDDVIETYLMQKNRGNYTKFAGISKENIIFGIKILRPLLNYTKKYLQDYDDENGVPYSIDESNNTDHYSRNKIRHHIVSKLTTEEREEIIKEISELNKTHKSVNIIRSKKEFLLSSYEEIINLFDYYMEKSGEHRDISRSFVEEIKKAFKTKRCISYELTNNLLFELDYGEIRFINRKKLENYAFSFKNTFKNDFLDIDFSLGTTDRKVDLQNKNLVVKNCGLDEEIIIKNYSSKARRLFIDWKMPHYLRCVWPGIYDQNGNLLYIPRYRQDFVEKNKSKFVIKIAYFEEF